MQIGELSRLTGISTRMLRHYDSIGLVSPRSRVGNGYRDYSDDDVRRLVQVEHLKALGMSLQTIRDTLEDADVTPTELIDDLIASTRSRIAREQELITRLEGVRDQAAASWTEVLAIVGLMRGLGSPDPSRRQRVVLDAADSVPTSTLVTALLSEEDLNVAGALQWALTRRTSDAIPYLSAALDSPDEHTRLQAITAVTKLTPA
ncbi:MerR family transcriptional regulator, partial [Williamsia sp.]|uniref:MerR family transcriptional regulator n=1 Tax=Williamsia sp. TaxID=1872085 RepID=UPI001A1DC3FE